MHLNSIDTNSWHLEILMPFIGELPLSRVHDGTLKPFVSDRKENGVKNKTVNLSLFVVCRVLNLAARSWRDEEGMPWLSAAPLFTMLPETDAAKPYPLDWDEQRKLFSLLPDHLAEMALYKVNIGGREQEICQLQWDWEIEIPELDISVFLIPKELIKNGEERLHVLNAVASSVVKARRQFRPETHHERCATHTGEKCNCIKSYVFGYRGLKVGKMNTKAWRHAWEAAGLPVNDKYRRGIHNLKHTFGRRLRAAGVPLETRKVLLGHTTGDITTHYSAAEVEELLKAVKKLDLEKSGKSPALTLLKRKSG